MRKKLVISFAGILTFLLLTGVGCGLEPKRAYLEIDSFKCTGCAKCPAVCITDAIRLINGIAVIDPTKCVECGRCVEVCPVDAVY